MLRSALPPLLASIGRGTVKQFASKYSLQTLGAVACSQSKSNNLSSWTDPRYHPLKPNKVRNLLEKYEVSAVTKADYDIVTEHLLTHFLKTEPFLKASNLSPHEYSKFLEYLTKICIEHDYSIKAMNKDTRELIGIRLTSVAHRDSSKNYDPFDIYNAGLHPKLVKIVDMLVWLKQEFWRLRPQAQKILHREIISVHPDHHRNDLGMYITNTGLNFPQLKKEGFYGAVSEATAVASQKMLPKTGYKPVGPLATDPDLKLHDSK